MEPGAGTETLTLEVPAGFRLPQALRDATPHDVAGALALGADVLRLGRERAERSAHGAEISELQQECDSLRGSLLLAQNQVDERARALSGEMVRCVTDGLERSHGGEVAALQAQVRVLEEQLKATRSAGDTVSRMHEDMTHQFDTIKGSTRHKGQIGEQHVLSQIALLCPDSNVTSIGDTASHRGDGEWVRHFGTTNLSMQCFVEVKNVDRIRSEELQRFHDQFDARASEGASNCAMFISLQPAHIPAHQGRSKYSAFFTLEWRHGMPVLYASNVANNPDLLSVCVAAMQQVWLYCDRVGTIGASGTDSTRVDQQLHLVNNFVNEQYELHKAHVQELTESAHQLQAMLHGVNRRKVLHQRQIENIANRIVEALGPGVSLQAAGGGDGRRRRRRTGTVIAEADMTDQQRAVVARCQAHVAETGAKLRSVDINQGRVSGVSKYDVDSMFGNFTSLKLTVQSLADATTRAPAASPGRTA